MPLQELQLSSGRRVFYAGTGEPATLVLAYHGRAQEVDGTQGTVIGIDIDFVGMSGLVEICERRKVAIAFMEGNRRRGDTMEMMTEAAYLEFGHGRDWDFDNGQQGGWPGPGENEDVQYTYEVVNHLESLGVHNGKIVVAGFSNGSSFAHYAVHSLVGLVVGAVFHSGGIKKPLNNVGPNAGSFPVVVLSEQGGMFDIVKRKRMKLAQKTAEIYRQRGHQVFESYIKSSHRWRSEENDAIFDHLQLFNDSFFNV